MAQVNLTTTIYGDSPILSITFLSQVTGESEIITFTLAQNQTLPFLFDPTNYGLNPNDVYGTFTIEFYNKCTHSVNVVGTVYECDEYQIINGGTGYQGLSVEDYINLPPGHSFVSATPETFQLGITDYNITTSHTVPAGYINTNEPISCTGNTSFITILELVQCPVLNSSVFPAEGISGSTVTLTGDLPAPFNGYTSGNGYTISPSQYTGAIGDSTTYTITFDTPNGYYTMDGDTAVTDGTIDCTYQARTIGVFTCDMAGINVLEGEVGADVQFTFNTVYGSDYVTLVGPQQYQAGTDVAYTFNIELPPNYVNENGTDADITCIADGTSLLPFSCPTIAIPEGTLGSTINTNGITLNPQNIGTVESIAPNEYQLGEFTYDVTITVADGFEGQGTTEICPAILRTCYVPVDGVPAFTATVID